MSPPERSEYDSVNRTPICDTCSKSDGNYDQGSDFGRGDRGRDCSHESSSCHCTLLFLDNFVIELIVGVQNIQLIDVGILLKNPHGPQQMWLPLLPQRIFLLLSLQNNRHLWETWFLYSRLSMRPSYDPVQRRLLFLPSQVLLPFMYLTPQAPLESLIRRLLIT